MNFTDGVNHDINPDWLAIGKTRLVYDVVSPPYLFTNFVEWNEPARTYYEIVKTCSNYRYQNVPQPVAGNNHSWYDKYTNISISGSNRLTTFGNWLNGTGYYQVFSQSPVAVDPFKNSSGTKYFEVWNTTDESGTRVFRWFNSDGTKIQEGGLYYRINWNSTPIDSSSYTLDYTGVLPDGPESPEGVQNPGMSIDVNGTMPIRTTAGTTGVTTIDPVLNLPAGVSGSYLEFTLTSKMVVVPQPKHNLIKMTFLSQAVITNGPLGDLDNNTGLFYYTIPIRIESLQDRYFYCRLGQDVSFVVAANTNRIPDNFGGYQYWQAKNPTNPGMVGLPYGELADPRTVVANVSFVPVSTSTGVYYNVTLRIDFKHGRTGMESYPMVYNQFCGTTKYVFTGVTPEIPYVVGEKVQFNLTMQSPPSVVGGTGNYYQQMYLNIDLGTIEAEVLDI